ncbi:glycosyl hydrolase family 18 protein [Vibrio metschnikovii]
MPKPRKGIWGSYLAAYGLHPESTPWVGQYQRHFDSVAIAPWLRNAENESSFSTEDKQSIDIKADYVIDKEIGGIMFWELAKGDYNYVLRTRCQWSAWTKLIGQSKLCASGNGEYHMG